MSGLEIRNTNNDIIFSSPDKVFLFLGQIPTTGQATGSFDAPILADHVGERVAIAISLGSYLDKAPKVYVLGTTIYWEFLVSPSNTNAPHTIIYGVI